MSVSAEKIAWLAGLFDGEGSCRISRAQEFRKDGSYSGLRYHCQVHITNTNRSIISEVIKIFDGLEICYYFREIGNPKQNPRYSPCYQIRASKVSDMRKLLFILSSHLIGKKSDAELCLKFLEGHKDVHQRQGKQRVLDREIQEILYNSQEFKHPRKQLM